MTDTPAKRIAGGALVAIAAGLAAALLFVLAARGSFVTLALGYFAPLPVMVAAISFGMSIGAGAVLVGGSFIAAVFHPALALVFVLAVAAPAALVAIAAILAPPIDETHKRDRAPTYAVLAITFLSFTGVAAAVGVLSWMFGGFQPLLAQAIRDAGPVVKQVLSEARVEGPLGVEELTRFLVLAAPVALVASQILMMILNLWLAGRVAIISGNLPRPWPSLADDLALPPALGALFAACCGLAFVGGLTGALSGAAAAALGAAFALQGLAVAHVVTRGVNTRIALLVSLYALILLLPPWPFCLLAIVGLADAAFHLRTRKSASLPEKV
jgi:hypothetical protein